jgi:hypothetical protein
MTVVGLIAARFGPVVGGLFLAFPAIFPASATLIEKHVGTQGESGSAESASRQGSCGARCRRSGAWKFRIGGFGLVIWLMIVQSPRGLSSLRPRRGSPSRSLVAGEAMAGRRVSAAWAISYCPFP